MDMGAVYGAYVWSCYGLTLAVLACNVWAARRQLCVQIAQTHRRLQSSMGSQS